MNEFGDKLLNLANKCQSADVCDEISKAMDTTDLAETAVEVHLPKFKLESDNFFKEIFEEVGINRIFNAEKAEFMKSQEPLEENSPFMQQLEKIKEEMKAQNEALAQLRLDQESRSGESKEAEEVKIQIEADCEKEDSELDESKDEMEEQEEEKVVLQEQEEEQVAVVDIPTVEYEVEEGEHNEVKRVKLMGGLALEEIVQKCIFEVKEQGLDELKVRDALEGLHSGMLQPFRCSRPFLFAVLVKVGGEKFILQLGSFQKPEASGYTYSD